MPGRRLHFLIRRVHRHRLGWLLVAAIAPGAAGQDNLLDKIQLRYLVKLQGSVTQQEPADSSLNPDNAVLEIPGYNYNSQLRLDLNAEYGSAAFFIKPRFVAERLEWSEGPLDGEADSDTDSYVNEWQLRLGLGDKVYASYGRENLQWGPSYLFSPSNPFIQENGQNNPKREVPGLDYAKVLWVPNRDWSVSLVANTGEGEAEITRNIDDQYNEFVGEVAAEAQANVDYINQQYEAGLQQISELRGSAPGRRGPLARELNRQADELESLALKQRNAALAEVESTTSEIYREADLSRDVYNRDFQRQYAIKVDYMTLQKYATVITSYKETDNEEDARRTRLGGYAGVTASEALLVYAEAGASLRGDELYPVEDPASPLGLRLLPTRAEDDDFRGAFLGGASYTFESGRTIVAEYLYNGVGYSASEADDYYELRERSADALSGEEPLPTLGLINLATAQDVGLRFLRRNYLLLQFQEVQVVGDMSFVLRSTLSLDDGSAQLIPILQYNLGDYVQAFAILNHNVGSKDTEFTSTIDHAYQAGLELTF